MRRSGILGGILSATALLAACGNSPTGQEFRAAVSAAGEVVAPGEQPPPEKLGRASFELVPGPLLFVVLRNGAAAAPMVPFGDNRGFRTWSTAEKQTLTLRQGVLVATRGLGDDLMSADVSATARALASGSGEGVVRITRHLDGEDGVRVRSFACSVTTAGREPITLVSGEALNAIRVTEACSDGTVSFRNTYWKTSNGTVRRSRQWVSPDVGYATIEVLRE
jgi:hypothetical protein